MTYRRMMAAAVLAAGLGLTGCGPGKVPGAERIGPGAPTVRAAVQSMGGLDAWQSADDVRARAVVTIYGNGVDAYVTRTEQLIDLPGGTVRASADAPAGEWRGTARVDGKVRTSGTLGDERHDKRLAEAMVMLIRRLRGPMNLLAPGVQTSAAERVSVAGEKCLRVAVSGDPMGADAYYFDATTHVLRYITVPADEGRGPSVTVLTYAIQPNGMAFCRHVSVVRPGEFTLVGDEPVLEVDYTEVEIR